LRHGFLGYDAGGHTSVCSNQIVIIARGGLKVCDAAHSGFVMKKVRRRMPKQKRRGTPGLDNPKISGMRRITTVTQHVAQGI
jgi:hypothetical protein